MKRFEKYKNHHVGALIARLGLATIFLYEGITKFMAMDMVVKFFGMLGFPPFLAYFVATVEIVGGVMMLLGFATEIAGVALAILMAVVILKVPGKGGFLNGHLWEFTLLMMALAAAFIHPGKYALGRKKDSSAPSA